MPMSDPRPFQDPLMLEMSLRSDINGSDYGLRIRLPQSYAHGEGRYPVMVVLDAEFMFYTASELSQLEAMWSHAPLGEEARTVPEVIVVSVALPSDPPNPFRRNFEYMPPCSDEDFTPSLAAYLERIKAMLGRGPEFGGASTFLQVLRDEILSAIDANYRTDTSKRILVGASASGCFGAFALLTQPELFTAYIIVSPGPAEEIFRMEAAWANAHDDLPARVLLTVGEKEIGDPLTIFGNTVRLSEALSGRGYPSLRLQTWIVPGATHIQAAAPSISRGVAGLGRA
jgi:predicted alpha/beta superfamily hydrolase